MSVIKLNAEQIQMVEIINNYAARFPHYENGDALLLQNCYDYMDAFKQVMDTTSRVQMDYIYQQYDGFYRFTKLIEMLAKGIADGIIEVPQPH